VNEFLHVLGVALVLSGTVMLWERGRYGRWPWQIDRYLREQEVGPIRNRILWNDRAGNDIDEIVISDCDIHVEQMNDRCWWIGVYPKNLAGEGGRWAGNFECNSRGRMTFSEQESDMTWEDDREHQSGGSESERS
jgi:hypothetical protein